MSQRRSAPIQRERAPKCSGLGGQVDRITHFLVGPKGLVVRDRFLPIGPNGRATTEADLRFDDAANWTLVAALVSDPHVRVTHLFVAPAIRARLLAYAAASGASSDLRTRAAFVLMQPTDAPLHDDHFHVRIACPAESQKCVEVALHKPTVSPPADGIAGTSI